MLNSAKRRTEAHSCLHMYDSMSHALKSPGFIPQPVSKWRRLRRTLQFSLSSRNETWTASNLGDIFSNSSLLKNTSKQRTFTFLEDTFKKRSGATLGFTGTHTRTLSFINLELSMTKIALEFQLDAILLWSVVEDKRKMNFWIPFYDAL